MEGRPLIPGDGGGEGRDVDVDAVDASFSTKKEYEMSLEIQSKLAMISFSFRVSQASLNGSNISLGLSPPCPALTSSNACATESFSGCDRFASRDAWISTLR